MWPDDIGILLTTFKTTELNVASVNPVLDIYKEICFNFCFNYYKKFKSLKQCFQANGDD